MMQVPTNIKKYVTKLCAQWAAWNILFRIFEAIFEYFMIFLKKTMTEMEFPKTFISISFCRWNKVAYVPLRTWVCRHAVSLCSTE